MQGEVAFSQENGGRVVSNLILKMGNEMENKYNPKLLSVANMLRKRMTKAEKHLWYDFLHTYPVRFYRQKVLGKYVVDFYCSKAKLVVELDGSGHYSEQGREHDEERTYYLKGYGIRVIRISNAEVHNNFRGVCDYIDHTVKEILGED